MKTKYFSNSGDQTLDDLKITVDKWIASHKNINVIEMKTTGPSKANPPEFFIKMCYDDKMPPRVLNTTTPPVAKRR